VTTSAANVMQICFMVVTTQRANDEPAPRPSERGKTLANGDAARATVTAANAQMVVGKRGGRIGSIIDARPLHPRRVRVVSGPLLGIALLVNGARNWIRSR
jgi:hypothetical protein